MCETDAVSFVVNDIVSSRVVQRCGRRQLRRDLLWGVKCLSCEGGKRSWRRRRKVYSGANAVNEEDPERDRATRTRSQIACCLPPRSQLFHRSYSNKHTYVKRASSRHHLGFAKSHNFSTSWGDASSRHHLCVTLLSTSVTATRPAGSTVMRPGLRKRAAAPVPSSKLPPASRCLPAHSLGASLAWTTPGDAVG